MLDRGREYPRRPQGEADIPHVPPAKRHPYDQWSPDARALDLVGDKWTLLIVRDLMPGPRRFVELQRVLPGISTEQLRSRLNRMVADGMLTRKRYREVPPRVDYELTERARELAPVLGELARWGWEWSWGAPRPTERVDVGAIFRLLPGLIGDDAPVTGSIQLTVTDGEHPASTRVTLGSAGTAVAEQHDGEGQMVSDAQISGTTSAWIQALGPGGSSGSLTVSGSTELADFVLARLELGQTAAPELPAADSVAS
jgi:DNA-binding HxlR family transcriptional regulator